MRLACGEAGRRLRAEAHCWLASGEGGGGQHGIPGVCLGAAWEGMGTLEEKQGGRLRHFEHDEEAWKMAEADLEGRGMWPSSQERQGRGGRSSEGGGLACVASCLVGSHDSDNDSRNFEAWREAGQAVGWAVGRREGL